METPSRKNSPAPPSSMFIGGRGPLLRFIRSFDPPSGWMKCCTPLTEQWRNLTPSTLKSGGVGGWLHHAVSLPWSSSPVCTRATFPPPTVARGLFGNSFQITIYRPVADRSLRATEHAKTQHVSIRIDIATYSLDYFASPPPISLRFHMGLVCF